jgi:pimeloyl-ACP methyl ester carboxylesterase
LDAPTTRILRPARFVALALIALAVLGLAYLRFAPDGDSVSVPAGGKAGDLTLERCNYATEDGSYEADCGTLVVLENRHDPDARLIALPITRIRAQSANRAAPIFYFHGGPGGTTMNFPAASRFADHRDVVLVGYRGVDGSRLDCPEVVSARERSRDWLSTASLETEAAAFRSCAERLRGEGVDLAGYTLPQRVDDIELARRKLGYGPIDLVSESFGTRVAMVYAWRYPTSIHRSVLVGVNPPGHFLWDAKTTGEQLRRYAALCVEDESCRTRTDDLAASVYAAYDRIPSRWWFLPIKKGNVRALALFGMFKATSDGAGPMPRRSRWTRFSRSTRRRERRVAPLGAHAEHGAANASCGRRCSHGAERRRIRRAVPVVVRARMQQVGETVVVQLKRLDLTLRHVALL